MAKEFKYRSKPTSQCPYKLHLTPKEHFVSAGHKIIEMVIINNFGQKNIPLCIWWRQSDPDTPTKVFNFQKSYWSTVNRLLKTYSAEVVMTMVNNLKIKFLSPKMIARYLYWCKIAQDDLKRVENSESRYNKEEEIVIEDKPVIDVENTKSENIRDWLD